MGKRRVIVFSSSSSEGEDDRRVESRSGATIPSKRKARSGTKSALVAPKKSKISRNSAKRSVAGKVDFDHLSEDFYECLQTSDGYGRKGMKELWVDKHKPGSLETLAVHKKKVGELRKWLADRKVMSKIDGNVLLVVGPAGVGKSTTIHVLVSELGFQLCEWRTPIPTLWHEHLHNSSSGIRYTSKLDEFATFVDNVRKFPVLQSICAPAYTKPVILLIDDIPLANGRVAYGKLSHCLQLLARATHVPTIILMTQYSSDDSGDNRKHNLEELEACLERAGAYKVSFNPFTVNSIKKTLSRICREENCNVPESVIDQISRSSAGDIRHAITSLQYFCLQPAPHLKGQPAIHFPLSSPSITRDGESQSDTPLSFGRDETVSIFHALGKFLHNKRESYSSSEGDSFSLHERYRRYPLKMAAPEEVLSQAHGATRPVTDFLHENVLDFLSNEAISDACVVASYLSDADCLLASSSYASWSRVASKEYEPEHISQLIAASVAARGVLFGNAQSSSSRWHSIRTPKLWQVDQSSRFNKKQMLMERQEVHHSRSSCSISEIATEYMPTMKQLGYRNLVDANWCDTQSPACKMEDDSADCSELNDSKDPLLRDIDVDDIEDW